MEDFPSNSHTARIKMEKEPEKAESSSGEEANKKVVTGKVKERPKTIGGRLKDMFIADGGNFSEQLYENVIKPKAQEMAISIISTITDAVKDGFEEVITGGRPRRGVNRPSTPGARGPRVSYNLISSRNRNGSRFSDRDGVVPIRRSNRVRDLIVETRETGELVIEQLEGLIDSGVRHCTVGDYYDLMGERVVSTDHEWGWTNLQNARVRQLDDNEFLMVMPSPHPIES
jgi:hypothetical protein